MAQAIRDRFANIASIEVTESSAGVLTFAALNTNMGFLGRRDQALAMVIDELQWKPSNAAIGDLDAEADFLDLALTISNSVTDLTDMTDPRILAWAHWGIVVIGAVTSLQIYEQPRIKQYFPPLITAERTLYLGVLGTSLASAVVAQIRILFRVETLTAGELVELAEVFRLTS